MLLFAWLTRSLPDTKSCLSPSICSLPPEKHDDPRFLTTRQLTETGVETARKENCAQTAAQGISSYSSLPPTQCAALSVHLACTCGPACVCVHVSGSGQAWYERGPSPPASGPDRHSTLGDARHFGQQLRSNFNGEGSALETRSGTSLSLYHLLTHFSVMIHRLNQLSGSDLVSTTRPDRESRRYPSDLCSFRSMFCAFAPKHQFSWRWNVKCSGV